MSRVPSSNYHQFAMVPRTSIPRSKFDRSYNYKSTFDAAELIPFLSDPVYPGDTYNVSVTAFARVATLLNPIMDNIYMDIHFFFIPNRLVWPNWESFCGAQDGGPSSTTDYTIPQITGPTMGGLGSESLFDYFGIPPLVSNLSISALPFLGYLLTYDQWYRDENLQTPVTPTLTDGPYVYSLFDLQNRNKRHDYFTSCLPWPQKINDGTVVTVPLGSTAPVKWNDASTNPGLIRVASTGNLTTGTILNANGSGVLDTSSVSGIQLVYDPNDSMICDLADAVGASINDLRTAFAMQQLFELDARGGTRYVELVKAHFQTIVPDFRVQRVEYLGGKSGIPIHVHTVMQTSESDTTPQATLTAFATAAINGVGFTKSFVEHGYVLGIVSCRADLNYQQGIDRHYLYQTRYEWFWPSFAHLGEQAVLNREIYVQGNSDDDDVFGYQERYAELRFKNNIVTAQFRSDNPTPLDSWHLAQYFLTLPTLGSTFIEENPPMSRIEAVSDSPDFLFDANIKMICARPLPLYSTPGLRRL